MLFKDNRGKIRIEIRTDAAEQLTWSVQHRDQTILVAAPLGLTADGRNLGKSVTLGKPRRHAIHEQYPVGRNHAVAVNHCYVSLTEATNDSFPDIGLERDGAFLKAVFPASAKGWNQQGSIVTPWLVAIIADGLNALAVPEKFLKKLTKMRALLLGLRHVDPRPCHHPPSNTRTDNIYESHGLPCRGLDSQH